MADVHILRNAPSLPETEDELRAIAKMAGGRDEDLFLRGRASEVEVKKNGLGDYRIIHFATHGLMGWRARWYGGAGVGPYAAQPSDQRRCGLLTASEILSLKLDADLVILSACNTAAADGSPRAEGFSGLTRAFLSAGARSVIVSHWSIPSVPTVLITTRMVQERGQNAGVSWSEEMRRSIASMVEVEGPSEFAHPTTWGAFSIVGV